MPHPFLSDEWMAEARAIRERHAGETGKVTMALKINQVVTGAPFGDGTVETYVDTAKKILVDQDQAAGMQAMMAGKLLIQGDMMKIMALQTAVPRNEASDQIAQEIKDITA